MSLYGMMRTGVSGMAGQANRLSTVADNIANASTNGYKRASTQFSTLLVPNTPGSYNSGGVTTSVRYAVSQQGVLQYTSSISDLAVNGDGFFVVQDGGGAPFLTRAGSFVPDSQGRLVNAAGYYLMGYDLANGAPTPSANGFEGLSNIVIAQSELTALPSSAGSFSANLPAGAADVPPASLPSANAPGASYSAKSSMVVYDNLGGEVLLDIYFSKTGGSAWEMAVYDRADAAPNTSFPYGSGPLATQTVSFDPANGQLAAPTSVTVPVPSGVAFQLDLTGITQLATGYQLFDSGANGNPPSNIEQFSISQDGTLYAQYENGSLRALYRIPLADAPSPDMLTVLSNNIYAPSNESGDIRIGFPNEGGMGKMVSGALEGSNVDIAQELTDMIEAQRSYTANSKVFQTGSDLMDILVNLKR
jgi:flagellar hook protein FlgE